VDRDRAARAIEEFLSALGHDPAADPELRDTPGRVAEAWIDDLLSGERVDVMALLAAESFEAPPSQTGSIVVLRDMIATTVCPHHLLPALGTATVAYVPGARVAGLGTLARVVDALSHRLTLQETIGQLVVDALSDGLGATGAACVLRLRHSCLSARGERKDAVVETLATSGVLAPGGTHAVFLASLLGDGRGR
jgi:GTP cyclohydrolase IA